MRKLLMSAILLIIMLFNMSSNVLAGEPGLLRGKLPSSTTGHGMMNPKNATDGNHATSAYLQVWSTATYILSEPTQINIVKILFDVNAPFGQLNFYDSENKLIEKINAFDGYRQVNLKDVKKVVINNNSDHGLNIYEFELYEGVIDVTPPNEVSNLTKSVGVNSIELAWKNPTDSDFKHVNIYKYGTKVAEVTNSNYKLTDLNADKEYVIKITTQDTSNNESEGIIFTLKTIPDKVEEIVNLKVSEVSYKSVTLKWELPKDEYLDFVRIYRTVEKKKQNASSEFFFGKMVYAAEYTPIFETNGTIWKDLTVQPETTYEYKLTTTNIGGVESKGVTIKTTTAAEPPPEIGGGGFTEQENGDFLYSWTSPTTGKVKVLIDGKEYKTVDAAAKQILIPKADMKYDIFNRPKVTLVPISEDGKEGTPSKPPNQNGGGGTDIGGAKLPFTVKDMVTAGLTLLGLVAGFVLLGLAFRFVPKFIAMIYASFKSGKGGETSRTTERESRQRRSV